MHTPKVGILGGGPIGLEAALYARRLGYPVKVFERGRIGEHLRQWGHVKLFTPWSMNTSSWAKSALSIPTDDQGCPTGKEMVDRYLEPLAAHPLMKGVVFEHTRVVQVGRTNVLKLDMKGRSACFVLLVEDSRGERWETCDVLIDAAGVFGQPNPIGMNGLRAPGEERHGDGILFGLPDLSAQSHRLKGKNVVVVGSGMSAATAIDAMGHTEAKSVCWLTRHAGVPIHQIPDDPLPERSRLVKRANQAAERGITGRVPVRHLPQTGILELKRNQNQMELVLEGQPALTADLILANTGFRPDWSPVRELQVHLCYQTEGPMKLAAALSGTEGGDCMTQTGHGADSLISPEPGYFVVGHKSYGRRSDFLLQLGHQQIEDVFTLIPKPTVPNPTEASLG